MKSKSKRSEIPLEKLAEEALKEAVADAIAEHKRAGHPFVIWRDDKVIHVPAEEIVARETRAKYATSPKKTEYPILPWNRLSSLKT